MATILVIGASGFLGWRLYAGLPGSQVVGTYFLNQRPDLEYLDLTNASALLSLLDRARPSIVLYAAGLTDVDKCQENPHLAFGVNAEAVKVVAGYPGVKLIYYSTDYVFDGSTAPYDEHSPTHPLNVYGQSKVLGEHAALHEAGHNNAVIRVSGLYDLQGSSRSTEIKNPVACTVLADDDRFSRPVCVDDVISATRLILDADLGGVFHAAGPVSLSRYEFETLRMHAWGGERNVLPTCSTARRYTAARPQDTSLNTRRLDELGWIASSVPDALARIHTSRVVQDQANETELLMGIETSRVRAIIVDCVGGLLTPRTWLNPPQLVIDADRIAGLADSEREAMMTFSRLATTEAEWNHLLEQVTAQYAPNPPVWSSLPAWRQRYRLALSNNGLSRTFRSWVRRYGLESKFDVLANSGEVSFRKPDPGFYLAVADLLGVAATECIVMDDSEENLAGARRCGMITVQMHPQHGFPLSVHDSHAPTPQDLLVQRIRAIIWQLGYQYPIDLSTSLTREVGLDSLDLLRLVLQLEEVLHSEVRKPIILDSVSSIGGLVEAWS